jgi:hypothetical protein
MKNSAGSVPCPPCRARHGRSPRSDPPRIEEDSRRSQWLKGVLRSPGPIQRTIGPHEVRCGPPRHFSLAACLCSPYTDRRPCLERAASRRTGVGRVSPTAFLSILRGVLLLASMCGPLNFYRTSIVFPQPARPRLPRRHRWEPDAGAPHVRISGAGEGNPSLLLHQLSKDAGRRPTPMAWRSIACSSPRLYGLVR